MKMELMKRDILEVSAHTLMHNPNILPLREYCTVLVLFQGYCTDPGTFSGTLLFLVLFREHCTVLSTVQGYITDPK